MYTKEFNQKEMEQNILDGQEGVTLNINRYKLYSLFLQINSLQGDVIGTCMNRCRESCSDYLAWADTRQTDNMIGRRKRDSFSNEIKT